MLIRHFLLRSISCSPNKWFVSTWIQAEFSWFIYIFCRFIELPAQLDQTRQEDLVTRPSKVSSSTVLPWDVVEEKGQLPRDVPMVNPRALVLSSSRSHRGIFSPLPRSVLDVDSRVWESLIPTGLVRILPTSTLKSLWSTWPILQSEEIQR